jgi:predicted DNA-binding protein (MmcQ/YjbR family)
MRPARSEDEEGRNIAGQAGPKKAIRRRTRTGRQSQAQGCRVRGLAEATVAVKCAPTAEQASELRERYPEDVVRSTWYVGRYGWNTVTLGGAVPAGELRECSARRTLPPSRSFPKSKRP